MNINDVLLRVLKKNDQISEQLQHRNEEEDEAKLALEIEAREAREALDREIAEKFQNEEWEISKLEQLKRIEIDRQIEDEQWQSDELKKIEKEAKDRKSELERLRVAARELEETNRLVKAMKEEEEIAQLKRVLAAKEDNRRSNNIREQSSEKKKSSRKEDHVYEEENEEWGGSFIVEGASSEEEDEQPVRTSSKGKRNASGSPKKRLVAVDSTDDEEDLQSMSSRLRTARRKLSSASLPGDDSKSMRSAKARMARRNVSSASLRVQETEDDSTDEEDDYIPSPPRKGRMPNRKHQTSSGNVDDLMSQFQGLGNPHRSRSGSGSKSRSGSPMYMPGMHSNPYFPAYGGSFPPPVGPYGYGVAMPGAVLNSGIGNIVSSIISNVGNDNSINQGYRK